MKINIQLLSYWSVGSGKSGGSIDNVLLKDKNGLPYLPGKTLKGLFRDACKEARIDGNTIIKLLGHEKLANNLSAGALRFNSARINSALAAKIMPYTPYLYTTKTKNSLDDKKQSEEHSLRTIEMAIPLTLESELSSTKNVFDSDEKEAITNAFKMIRKLGEKRHRGMGRCKISEYGELSTPKNNVKKESIESNTLRLRCTLKDPLILVKKDKTEQNIESLDYLPGSLLRGIMANHLFNTNTAKVDDIIFNNKVQFGDGNLVIDNQRSYKVPFSYYKKEKEINYINFHHITDWGTKTKQVKKGYFVKKEGELSIKQVSYGSIIKSSRNSEKRSSEKAGLFVYHYLEEDQSFEFEITATDNENLKIIGDHLIGNTFYLGKSKMAEFGGTVTFESVTTTTPTPTGSTKTTKYIYADSNLCFVNDYGDFTATDFVKELTKDTEVEIDWSNSQLKTRTFAPYNAHRNNWDSERIIIEKGSLIVLSKAIELTETTVGCFQNEGYGKIIPLAKEDDIIPLNKIIEIKINESDNGDTTLKKEPVTIAETDNPLEKVLKSRHNSLVEKLKNIAYAENILSNHKSFTKISTSQWARVYNAASKPKLEKDKLREILFSKEEKNKTICDGGAKPWNSNTSTAFKKLFKNDELNTNVVQRIAKHLMNADND